jgi:outer membrane lipoprotein-sorting protein
MKLDRMDHRTTAPIGDVLQFRSEFVILLLMILVALWQPAGAQQPDTAPAATQVGLTAEQVVHNLVQMNLCRAQALHSYRGTRTYRAEYRGFSGARSAEMVVEVKYQSPGTKEFTIKSATGSKMIIDKVFKMLLQLEKESLAAEAQRRIALNGDNYDFILAGYDSTPFGSVYVLVVEPRTKDKFLYRGRIWVDARDFAVVRLEAEPAKNPSFWTKTAEIVQMYVKVSDFWLPAHNHSVTAIQVGGRAELTIDYKDYEITSAGPMSSVLTLRSTPHAVTINAQK